jgi:UDP-N-acetylmuramate--alanine ligase
MYQKERTQLHFVGIGGIGMSGIAEVFLNQGYPVTGSDLSASDVTRRLEQLGAKIFLGHAASNVQGAQVVVISSAVKPTNPEVMEARKLRIPVIPRAEMLGELMRGKVGIAVAGTHGKTTTTSMLATVLTLAGLDPTLVIGGKVDSLGGNAKLGQGKYVVAEADESDGSFLHLPASLGIVTNIDNDHLDHYGSLEAVEDAFVEFVGKLPFYGLAAVCGEDAGVQRCLARMTKPVTTYGFSAKWDFYADQITTVGTGSRFQVWQANPPGKHQLLGTVTLRVPGRHNILNSLAAVAIGMKLGLSFEKISESLHEFRGVKRRFEVRWENIDTRQLVIDDYGHHPTEIIATLAAAKQVWSGRIVTVFQPHRYSRTLNCQQDFLKAFHDSDVVMITDIYGAGEDPIEGVSADKLAKALRGVAKPHQVIEYSGDLNSTKMSVLAQFTEGDMILFLGAGSITKLAEQISLEFAAAKGTSNAKPVRNQNRA